MFDEKFLGEFLAAFEFGAQFRRANDWNIA